MSNPMKQTPLDSLSRDTVGETSANRPTEPRSESLPGRQIGNYRLISLIGKGGMGEVYLAEHTLLMRRCAIKLIRPDRARDPQVVARFEREVRMTARLSHRNIVHTFDSGRTADGTLYYVMEYLSGSTLDDIVEQQGPQSAGRVVHLLRQASRALQHAHAIGLVHRDIKPANLFVTEGDVVKVLDFGLVKPVNEISSTRLTQDGALSGTPLFMSPEQISGSDDVDGRSDIYSLGAVAYMLLTGRPPFIGSNPLQVMFAHAYARVTPPSEICPGVPADMEEVILRCLAKRPEERYQNMEELEQALAQCDAADRPAELMSTQF
jgi:serine/threonine-protein kinase